MHFTKTNNKKRNLVKETKSDNARVKSEWNFNEVTGEIANSGNFDMATIWDSSLLQTFSEGEVINLNVKSGVTKMMKQF